MDDFTVPDDWKVLGWPVDFDKVTIMPGGEHGPRPHGPGELVQHDGIDLATPEGTPVYASGPGVVTLVELDGDSDDGVGNSVWLSHIEGIFQTGYLHMLDAPLVGVGDEVHEGTLLGHVGQTGNAAGNHVCFHTKVRGHAVNPRTFIRDYGRPTDDR